MDSITYVPNLTPHIIAGKPDGDTDSRDHSLCHVFEM